MILWVRSFRQDLAAQFSSAEHQWGSLSGIHLGTGLGWQVPGGFIHVPAAENNDGLYSLTVGQMPGLALSTLQESVQSPHPTFPVRWTAVLPLGFPGGTVAENHLSYRRHWFAPSLRKMPWGRKWQPTQYSCLGNPMDKRSLASYSPWGRKEWDTT